MGHDRELSRDFDWHKNHSMVTQGGPPPVAVYRTIQGEVVVRQKASHFNDADSIIVLSPHDVRAVILAMTVCASAIIEDDDKVIFDEPGNG